MNQPNGVDDDHAVEYQRRVALYLTPPEGGISELVLPDDVRFAVPDRLRRRAPEGHASFSFMKTVTIDLGPSPHAGGTARLADDSTDPGVAPRIAIPEGLEQLGLAVTNTFVVLLGADIYRHVIIGLRLGWFGEDQLIWVSSDGLRRMAEVVRAVALNEQGKLSGY